MPREIIGRDFRLVQHWWKVREKTKYNINNTLYWQVTQLKYFLNAAPRRAPTQVMELKSKMDMPQKRKTHAKQAHVLLRVCAPHLGGSASSSGLALPEPAWLWWYPHGPYHCREETLWICPPASDVCCASALSTLCLRPLTAAAGLQTQSSTI